jgi:hypothetical protein
MTQNMYTAQRTHLSHFATDTYLKSNDSSDRRILAAQTANVKRALERLSCTEIYNKLKCVCMQVYRALLGLYCSSLRAGRSGDRIPVGGEKFRTLPDRLCGPPSLVYKGYRVFPGGKAAGAWR